MGVGVVSKTVDQIHRPRRVLVVRLNILRSTPYPVQERVLLGAFLGRLEVEFLVLFCYQVLLDRDLVQRDVPVLWIEKLVDVCSLSLG